MKNFKSFLRQSVRRSSSRSSSRKLRNPYDPTIPASDLAFVGRQDIISRLTNDLLEGYSYGLIGKTGIGKTSLLHTLQRALMQDSEDAWMTTPIPIYIEFDYKKFTQTKDILKAILKGSLGCIEKKFSLVYPTNLRNELDIEVNKENLDRPLSKILDWFYGKKGYPCSIILMFDDLHRSKGCEALSNAVSIMRPIVARKDMVVILSGELPLEEELRNDVSPLRGLVAEQLTLEPLLSEEVSSLLDVAKEIGWSVEVGADSLLHGVTHGHPYRLHYYLFNALSRFKQIDKASLIAIHQDTNAQSRLSKLLKQDNTPPDLPLQTSVAKLQMISESTIQVRKPDNTVVGTAFFVSHSGLIATCAHVVELAGVKKGESVNIHIPQAGIDCTAFVMPQSWREPAKEDVALLQLEGILPVGVQPVKFGGVEHKQGHVFRSFGYPKIGTVNGLWATGTIQGVVTDNELKLLQLASPELAQGMSGAPVLDIEDNCVVGMVTSVYHPDKTSKHRDTAFATLAEDIISTCPSLLSFADTSCKSFSQTSNRKFQVLKEEIATTRELLLQNPVEGAAKLSQLLENQQDWLSLKGEVDLKRSELQKLKRDEDLYGEAVTNKPSWRRAVHHLIQICLDLEQSMQ
jgi:energy-coupling factor transporter ATP-binding protein EcfA2